MNTCKSCKWRKPVADSPENNQSKKGGWCECPKLHEKYNSPAGENEYSPDHLVYSYYEGGGFWTGNDFGCVHWAAKP